MNLKMLAFDERGAINIYFNMFESSNHSLLFPLFSRLTKSSESKKKCLIRIRILNIRMTM